MTKKDQNNKRQAIVDMASALKDVFKGYTRTARHDAWKRISSPEGKKEVEKLVQDPYRPINTFQKLAFREWVGTEEFSVNGFIQNIGRQVLASMKVQKGSVRFRFPSLAAPTASLRTQSYQQQASPMSIAAHATYDGNAIMEDKEGTEKSAGASKALRQVATPDWSGTQWQVFEKLIKTKIRDIAPIMGFLFEIEIYMYLIEKKHMADHDDVQMNDNIRISTLKAKREKLKADMRSKLRSDKQLEQLYVMLSSHAANLADQIYVRTTKVLRCVPDRIVFTGGEFDWSDAETGRANPADLILMCGDEDRSRSDLGWNVKLTSETRVNMAHLSVEATFKLLGGTNTRQLQKDIDSGMQNSNPSTYYSDFRMTVIPLLAEVAEANVADNPQKFADLMNYLISGKEGRKHYDTLPAVRNYASVSIGGAGWSEMIRKDFDVTSQEGRKLRPKQGAKVTVIHNETYVKIIYKVPGGSPSGTFIQLEPRSDSIIVKVNNLTSAGR